MQNNHQNNVAQQPGVNSQGVIRFDKNYVTTVPGILKITEIVCNFIGFIAIKISTSFIAALFYNLLYWIGNIITFILFLLYTFHIVEKYNNWPWNKFEMFYCGIMTLCYIVCSILAATVGESVGYAVGFFGFCAFLAYGFDGYLKFKSWKQGLPAQ